MTLPKLLAKTQEVFNRYIRKRDEGLPCISCGRNISAGSQASHYFSAGHYTALRFDERNVHASCKYCNMFLHGNLINYRKGLIKRYGVDFVEGLEKDADLRKVHKWSREELLAITRKYQIK